MINLVSADQRENLKDADVSELVEKLYWKSGATELASGKKTLTLLQFEEKYMNDFYETGLKFKKTNLRQVFYTYFANSPQKEEIIQKLRAYDLTANVLWRLAHLKSSGQYLNRAPEGIPATGGTNWQKYLPPRFQRIMFFPELWSEQEKSEWGKAAVVKAMQ